MAAAVPGEKRFAELVKRAKSGCFCSPGQIGCRDGDIEVTAKSLALSALSVKKGEVINEATHVALGWLDEHVPRLRFKQG